MARFKLLAGQHIGPDFSCKPDKNGRYPSKTYSAGETVESGDVDLVDKFGAEKFQLIGPSKMKGVKSSGTGNATPGDPTPFNMRENAAHFPAGQVSTGRQSTSGGTREDGGTDSGPMDPEDAEDLDDQEAEEGGSVKQQSKTAQPSKSSPHPKEMKTSSHKPMSSKQNVSSNKPLESMSVKELQSFAEAEEIDLGGKTKREEIIQCIKEDMSSE